MIADVGIPDSKILIGLALLAACGGGERDDGTATSAITVGVSESATDPDGGTTDDAEGGSESDLKLDLGAEGTGGNADDGGETGECEAVDILFIVDDSLSMEDDQAALAAAFPAFADAMFGALPEGVSLHVAVTTSSGFWSGVNEENTFECVSDYSNDELADGYWPPEAGSPAVNGQQGALYEYEGQRFFATDTSADPAALSTWFTGAALRGENGTNVEFTAAAAGWALDPLRADTNAGFLRDEGAVLVLFFITDEPDKSPEPVQQFVDKVLAAKTACGGEQCIITAGAVPSYCYEHAGDTTLFDFMNAFGKPPASLGFIPESFLEPPPPQPDYAAVLGEALAGIIAETCDAIIPEG